MINVSACMECGLEIDSINRGMIEAKFDDLPNLVLVYTAFNGWYEYYFAVDLSQSVEARSLIGKRSGSPRMMR